MGSEFSNFEALSCQLSRGEICVANFIPPVNGASQGNYFLAKVPKMAVVEAKMAVFEAKTGLQKLWRQPKLQTFFEMISIFELMREEAKNFRKPVSRARA